MTSKLVVNTIEADTGISSVSFASSISLSSTSVFHLGDAGINIGADTNINRAGNGVLAFNINSSEKLRIDSNGKLTLSNSEGIQLSAKTSSLYTSDGSISYYASNNAVYINGAGASGWMRLNAAGTANNRTAINIYGHSYSTPDTIDFRTNSSERLRIGSSGQIGIGGANYGTSGQVLTSQGSGSAVQWATPSSGDYVKIQRGTNGSQGASGFVFDNLDVATYKFFDFNAAFVPGDDGQYPYFRFRTGGASGADVTGTHYSYGYGESYPSNQYTQGSQTGHSQVTLSGTLGYNTNNGEGLRINMRIMFADANDNGSSGQLSNFITYQYIRVDASGNPRMGHGSAIYNQNTSTYPTGFRLYMASGGINSNSFGLYGMKR